MASQLEDIERIFQDLSNHSKVKSLEICNGLDTNTDLQLQKHKNHLGSLKTMLVSLQTQSCFLENMTKENCSSMDSMEITEHQVNVRKESKEDKLTIEQLERDLDDLAETLCTKQNVLKEKLELVEQKLTSIKDKKNKYEMLKEKSQEIAGIEEEKENGIDEFNELQARQLEVYSVIEQCKAAISSLEHCKGLLQYEAIHWKEKVDDLQQDSEMKEALKQDSNQAYRQWVSEAVKLFNNLGGIRVQNIQGDSIVLEIANDAQPRADQADTPLILTIKYRLELAGDVCAVFVGAQVNLASLSIDDLVSQAAQTKDVVEFILQVKRRFRNQRSLIEEVEELQKKIIRNTKNCILACSAGLRAGILNKVYAIDWEPSHGRIRVMLGKSGKIVCTLKVDPMYCIGRGNVQLLRVEGSCDQTGIERLQRDGSSRNLTEWIKDLQELFSTP